MTLTGFYTFYNMGKVNGQGPNLICFNLFKSDKSYGSCRVVEEQEAAKEREAFLRIGYLPLVQS
jgi:hypothetical protein